MIASTFFARRRAGSWPGRLMRGQNFGEPASTTLRSSQAFPGSGDLGHSVK